ncbi:MAG: phenylacetate-CoA oxygenase subunit PaaJ [Proteobacteria bacterium]|nr:MAG: phenylacetate-CoA oxygenase subunit PaaJ [Pseudomonadota bacterium]
MHTREEVLKLLETVSDPEIPVINVVEMGIVREVHLGPNHQIKIDITPTYSGCPAMKVIEDEITAALSASGFKQVEVRLVYSPPWTTDWLSAEAKRKLKEYGIAPPGPVKNELVQLGKQRDEIECPFCNSDQTELRSSFGSTACKAMYYCRACRQPFEYFKDF